MNAKDKAKELVEKYKYYVHGYVGSSMLTNHEYPEQILSQAKKCALIAVDEILKVLDSEWTKLDFWVEELSGTIHYWQQVKSEIEKL